MVSGLSSDTGGEIGADSFIGATPLSYGRGSEVRVPRRRSLIRPTSSATFSPREKGRSAVSKPTVLGKGDPASFAAPLQPADDALT